MEFGWGLSEVELADLLALLRGLVDTARYGQ
jgi:hypothetical protein